MKNIKKIIAKVSETKIRLFENMKLMNVQSDSPREAKRRLKSIKVEMKDK